MAEAKDSEQSAPKVARRDFVTGSVSLAVLGCAGKPEKFDTTAVPTSRGVVALLVSEYPPLATAGGMVAVHPAGLRKPILVMRLENDTFRALSMQCTHLGCTVRWDHESQDIACPCHGSHFDDAGRPTRGPAKTALTSYTTSFERMTVHIRVGDE